MKIIDERCLDRFRGEGCCEWCGQFVQRREPHHFFYKRGMSGGSRLDVPENLIALCATFHGGNCHHRAEACEIKKEQLLEIVAKREGKSGQEIVQYLTELKWKRKQWTALL